MKFGEWLKPFKPKSLKLNAQFLEAEFEIRQDDKDAAWEMYVYLITTILTQELPEADGDEATALKSAYQLFGVTREILTRRGREAPGFSRIAVIILNRVVRPFTARWHRLSLEKAFDDPEQCAMFRQELADLQVKMRAYAKILSRIAGVEDITDVENTQG